MPMYSFRCQSCGHEYEELAKRFGEQIPCPQCGSADVERMVEKSAPTLRQRVKDFFKGGGGCGGDGGGFKFG